MCFDFQNYGFKLLKELWTVFKVHGVIMFPSSTPNEARQLIKGEVAFIDKCSGAVPFMQRPQAKKMLECMKTHPTSEIVIISVDRIGRSTLDILQTIQYIKEKKYLLRINNLGMDNTSPFFDLMISLLGVFQHPIKFIELGFILLHFFFVQKPIIVIGCFTFNFDNFWLASCAFKQLVSTNSNEVSPHRASQLKVGVTNTF
jgi:hypothetical protein